MRVIFISGAYTADTPEEVEHNIDVARQASIALRQLGWSVFTPHLNSGHLEAVLPSYNWIRECLIHLTRCDALYALSNYESSEGAKREIELAKQRGMPVYWQVQGLVTPSGGIIKVHQCKFPIMIDDENNRERFCGHCGFTEYMDKPITTDSRSFARIK